MRSIFIIKTATPMKVQGEYQEVSTSHVYVIATSFEEALAKFRTRYPKQENNVSGINLVNYCYGMPIIE